MRYLITLSYDGSKYSGYQKQIDTKTIQGELENALSKLNNRDTSITASGRTDRGVHAISQCAHFDLDINITSDKLKMALNSMLPDDIYVKKAEEVSNDFHARFNVESKEYIYKINVGEYNPIEKDYIYQYCSDLNIDKMCEAIKIFEGVHNFKSYVAADDVRDNYVREIISTNIEKNNNIITITFIGTGFLRYMVRNMVGSLIEVGEGKKTIADIETILSMEDRKAAGKTAPACGLYLYKVNY